MADLELILHSLSGELTGQFGPDVNITHNIDFTNRLIETIIELSVQLGIDLENFLNATLFPFMVNLNIENLSIISNIDVLLNGGIVDSKPTQDGFNSALGIFASILNDGGSLPDIIDLWHVIVVQPSECCPFSTTIEWSDDFMNPYSSTFLTTSIDIGTVLMTGD